MRNRINCYSNVAIVAIGREERQWHVVWNVHSWGILSISFSLMFLVNVMLARASRNPLRYCDVRKKRKKLRGEEKNDNNLNNIVIKSELHSNIALTYTHTFDHSSHSWVVGGSKLAIEFVRSTKKKNNERIEKNAASKDNTVLTSERIFDVKRIWNEN